MTTIEQAREAKEEFKTLCKTFNDLVGPIGLSKSGTDYTIEARLLREPTDAERQALPKEITAQSNITLPVKYTMTGNIAAQGGNPPCGQPGHQCGCSQKPEMK